jgi:hypothetical protein
VVVDGSPVVAAGDVGGAVGVLVVGPPWFSFSSGSVYCWPPGSCAAVTLSSFSSRSFAARPFPSCAVSSSPVASAAASVAPAATAGSSARTAATRTGAVNARVTTAIGSRHPGPRPPELGAPASDHGRAGRLPP